MWQVPSKSLHGKTLGAAQREPFAQLRSLGSLSCASLCQQSAFRSTSLASLSRLLGGRLRWEAAGRLMRQDALNHDIRHEWIRADFLRELQQGLKFGSQ